MSTSMVWSSLLLVITIIGPALSEIVFPSPVPKEKESSYWYDLGKKELEEALSKPVLTNVAKNVILFLGDGMGVTANTAGRILKGQKKGVSGEEGYLEWERFPNIALMKTYNLDRQVPDSAATATAFLTGVKANFYTLGVNGHVKLNDCEASLDPKNRLDSILQWAQDAGKDTGVVTTAQVTHATPAGLYAKSASRKWQCDTKIMSVGNDAMKCKDIARQLVEDEPARNMKVIIGGGRQEMGDQLFPDTEPTCVRTDGRNLPRDWMHDKEARGKTSAYVTNTKQLRDVDIDDTDFLLGLFGDLHVPFEVDRNTSMEGTPHIKEMVESAINMLKKNDKGFFLLVEGGRIDHGLHNTQPRRALEELVAMEEAVKAAMDMLDLEETIMIVTADHSHVMTINGYPQRGNNILGKVEFNEDVTDGLPYTTLMFTNGHGYNYSWNGEEVMRLNLTGIDTTNKNFESLAGVPTLEGSETHGGEDVAAFAIGPMSHLFHRVHEQNYVAHVMAYAACIGPYKKCDRPYSNPKNAYTHVRDRPKSGTTSVHVTSSILVLLVAFVHLIRW